MRDSLRAGLTGLAVCVLILLLAPQPIPLPLVRDIHTAQVQNDKAVRAEALADAAARAPYDGALLIQAALAQLEAGQYAGAIKNLEQAAALEGWTPALRLALGDAYLGSGDRAAAIDQWEQARAETPDDPALLTRLADVYEAEGRAGEAAVVRAHLAELQPRDAQTQYRLGLYRAATAPDTAVVPLTLAASLSKDLAPRAQLVLDAIAAGQAANNEAYLSGRVGFALTQLQEWALAETALTQAVALDPGYADAHAYLGLTQDMQGKDGVAEAEAAIKLAPDSPLAQFLLALHWRRLGQSAKALPYLQAAQTLDPQNPAIAAEVGGAYASTGDLPQAEVWFTQAVNLAPQDAQFWLLLTRFYIDNEFHVAELGLPAARTTWQMLPDDPLAVEAYGYALFLTGDREGGRILLESAARLGPSQPSVFYHLGALYAAESRYAEAAAAFKHTLVLDPNGLYGGRALRALAQLPQ